MVQSKRKVAGLIKLEQGKGQELARIQSTKPDKLMEFVMRGVELETEYPSRERDADCPMHALEADPTGLTQVESICTRMETKWKALWSEGQIAQLTNLLKRNKQAFSPLNDEPMIAAAYEAERIEGAKPVRHAVRRIKGVLLEAMRKQINEWVKLKIIAHSAAEWVSRPIMIKKALVSAADQELLRQGGTPATKWRMVIDYRVGLSRVSDPPIKGLRPAGPGLRPSRPSRPSPVDLAG